jgi:hypothetical protein
MKKCNAYIEELCNNIGKEELNNNCQICGVKIAFHKRKKIKNVKNIVTKNYYMCDNFSKKHEEKSVESFGRKDLFSLPMNLLKKICIEWLEIKDISHFDHALCESIKRKILLEVLNGMILFGLRISISIFDDDDDVYQCYDNVLNFYLQWLSKRNIFIKTLILTKWDVVNEYYYRFYHLEKLVINLNDETEEYNELTFKLIFKFSKKLKQISITNSATFDERFFYSTLPCFAKLDSVSFDNCENFNDKCLAYLSIHGKKK